MEAPLLARLFGPLIGFCVFLNLGAAVSLSTKHVVVEVDANAETTESTPTFLTEDGRREGTIDAKGIYVASRQVVAEDDAPQKIEQPAFFRGQDAEPLEGDAALAAMNLRDDGEQPAALAEAEAFSTANLDEGFIWWSPRRRRRRYDCKWSKWEGWKGCTVECGAGQQQRDRHTDGPHWGGKRCVADAEGEKSQFQTCNLQGCPVDCNWAHWGPWGPCSLKCGFGLQVRQRGVLPYTDMDGGKDCPDDLRKGTQQCNRFQCPVPCTFEQWNLWGGCDLTCGAGLKRRTRDTKGPFHGGSACLAGGHVEAMKCNNFMCPVNCAWGGWSDWGVCSRTCGGGIRLHERSYVRQMENGGAHCPGAPAEVLACNIQECPSDCNWAEWHDPSPCTKTCGGGVFKRYRAKEAVQSHGGALCTGPNTEIGPCNVEPCAVDCQYSEWHSWTECSAPCGGGVHQALRNGTDPYHGGMDCYEQNKSKEEECNLWPCGAKSAAWQQTRYHVAVLLLVAAAPLLMQ